VPDPGAGAHHLHVAGFGPALVAEAVLVGDRALPDIGDDLHIGMRMRRKAGSGCNLVVVPYPQSSPPHALRVEVIGEREMVLGLEPVVPGAAQTFKRSAFDHVNLPLIKTVAVAAGQDWVSGRS
jgi:hypothetical protein